MSNKFAATGPATGYLYQVRTALYLFLKSNRDLDVSIEALDDIEFNKSGTPEELIQTKHHSRQANLTDSSPELWKTIRIWAAQKLEGKINLSETKLILITTSISERQTVAEYLSPPAIDSPRNPNKALKLLQKTASDSVSIKNKSAYKAFSSLDAESQLLLVNQITIIGSSPDILDTRDKIKSELELSTRPQFLEDFYKRLEGWWFDRVIQSLSKSEYKIILHRELISQINELQEQYYSDNLPIHFANIPSPKEDEIPEHERLFIEQLRLIMLGEPRIKKAISDYFRAFCQRSRWLRDGHILIGDLTQYESRLIDEWERLFLSLQEGLPDTCAEEDRQSAGRSLFNQIDQKSNLFIRPRCTEPYVMRGTYHILSNKGRVGWHPKFQELLRESINKAMRALV